MPEEECGEAAGAGMLGWGPLGWGQRAKTYISTEILFWLESSRTAIVLIPNLVNHRIRKYFKHHLVLSERKYSLQQV